MGYDISQEQYEKLERLRREGRQCAMSTGRGGCFNRATYREVHEHWTYHIDEGQRTERTMVFCGRHASLPGAQGVNYRVLSVERF